MFQIFIFISGNTTKDKFKDGQLGNHCYRFVRVIMWTVVKELESDAFLKNFWDIIYKHKTI